MMETRENQVRNFVAEHITYKDERVMTMLKEAAVLGMTWADAHPNREEQVVIPRWIVDKAFTALRLNYNAMVREGFEGCLRRQTATSYNYLKLFLEKEQPTDNEIKRVAVNYIDGEIDN